MSASSQPVPRPNSAPPGRSLFRAVQVGIVGIVVLEVVALILGLAVVGRHGGGAIQGWDNTVGRWWIHHRNHLVGVSKVIAVLGDAVGLSIISVVLTAILLALGQKMRALIPLVAYFGGEFVVFATRLVIARPRPLTANFPAPNAIPGVHETSYSYPSGHATAGTAVILGLATLAAMTWRTWWPWLVGAVLAMAVACSRLVLGVHWFSDVAFGLVIGAAWGILVGRALFDAAWPFARRGGVRRPTG